jgi:hypothetical protein
MSDVQKMTGDYQQSKALSTAFAAHVGTGMISKPFLIRNE